MTRPDAASSPSSPWLEGLNEQQRAAVEHTEGPQLVIAGAGSGKTRVLTCKIAHLLSRGTEPWRVLALTFTNKAAREMRDRIAAMVGERTAARLWMGTFHSVFYRILRSHAALLGFPPSFTIYDAADSKSAIRMVIRDLGLDEKTYKPGPVAAAISWAKNALISPTAYANNRELMEADKRSNRPLTSEIYRIYTERCRTAGAMDFDDLLYYTNVLLRDHPEVCRHYQEQFSYILVDEYQDTNFAQHLIVRQLAGPCGNVTMVGDDAQSIYSFRGANIRNILELRKSYPDLAEFKLERNYRSTQNIIDCAGSLIAKNTMQMPKTVYSTGDKGPKVEVVQSFSDYEEAFLVANRIAQVRMGSDEGWDAFAVLYRTNAQSRILEDALRKRNIPYRIYGGLSFYQRKEIRDAVAYFRLAINPADDEALRRVINFPARGLGETTVSRLASLASTNGISCMEAIDRAEELGLQANRGTLAKLHAFASMIKGFHQKVATADAYTLAEQIINTTGLLSMLMTDRTPETVSKRENLEELLAGASSFVEECMELQIESALGDGPDDIDGPRPTLDRFMQEVSLATDVDTTDRAEAEAAADGGDAPAQKVTLMTMHAAKGLEFSNVFIVGVEEDFLPNSLCQGSLDEIEEERRLLYVAITRARRFCMMSYAKSRFRNGQTAMTRPSRFLADINPQYLRLAAGAANDPMLQRAHNPVDAYRRRAATATAQSPAPASGLKPVEKAAPSGGGGSHTADELAEGMRVEHAKFGEGTIVAVDDSRADARVTVEFDQTGTKTLLLRFAHFNILQ